MVALPPESPELAHLNGSAAMLWEACLDPMSFDELVELVTKTYDVTPARAAADLGVALAELTARGLFEVRDPVPPPHRGHSGSA